jgi:hypothetical protein
VIDIDLNTLPAGEIFFQVGDRDLIISYAISKDGIEDIEIYSTEDQKFDLIDDQYLNC